MVVIEFISKGGGDVVVAVSSAFEVIGVSTTIGIASVRSTVVLVSVGMLVTDDVS